MLTLGKFGTQWNDPAYNPTDEQLSEEEIQTEEDRIEDMMIAAYERMNDE